MQTGTMLTKAALDELERVSSGEARPTYTDLARALEAALGHIAALSAVPEDVARDEYNLRMSLRASLPEGVALTEMLAALSRLASAAARVPGLEAELAEVRATLAAQVQRTKDVIYERDAAQTDLAAMTARWESVFHAKADEVAADKIRSLTAWKDSACAERDAARRELDDVRAAWHRETGNADTLREQVSTLTARVAELEQELRIAKETSEARAFSLGQVEEKMLALSSKVVAAEDRAESAEAKAAERQSEVDRLNNRLADLYAEHVTAPTPAGLREAVGPDAVCLHCEKRRAEHLRRHHGTGSKGTLWYCRAPTERPFTPRPVSLDAAVRAVLSGPLAWMLGPDSDWKDGEVGVGHGFRGQANEAHALLTAGLSAYDPETKGGAR